MGSPADARRVIPLIDLTDLNDDHDSDGLDELFVRAVDEGVAAVCIWPEYVARAAESLQRGAGGGSCCIATVVNFPGGRDSITDVTDLTVAALDDGADEVDLVLPYRQLRSGDGATARSMVEAIADVVHNRTGRLGEPGRLKVILETGELVDGGLIASAARLAIDAGADFIKSSTGKTPVSATIGAFSSMVDVVQHADRTVGLKPSGGIRTVDEAMEYLGVVDARLGADWATPATFRFGASGLLDDAVKLAADG